MFSFEAGRRCDSGPGNFTFETKQGNDIFTLVEQAIQSQKALAEERHLSGPNSVDPDCPPSLQQIRSAISAVASGDSSSNSSREADGDSGGSKPGSADGVLGKREGGDGGGGGGVGRGAGVAGGLKGRSLPEPPVLGVPPRGQGAAKGLSPGDEHIGVYAEPADSVRLPLTVSDCLYSDPVDSIKGQNQSNGAPNPPVPTPRLRPLGDEALGGGVQGDHPHVGSNHRKPPDLYSHLYDRISLELNQKTSALNLNGAGGGRGGGRGVNRKRRPPGGQAEGASSPPVVPAEHIYDEPEGRAKVGGGPPANSGMSIYDEAWLEPQSLRRQDEAAALLGPEGSYSAPSHGKAAESHRQSPPQPGQGRGTPQPPRWPKPITAPKPARSVFTRKELAPWPPGKHGGPGGNMNNNNNNNNIWGGEGGGGGSKELYSKVSKKNPPTASSWYSQQKQPSLRSPDIIYDNLGDI